MLMLVVNVCHPCPYIFRISQDVLLVHNIVRRLKAMSDIQIKHNALKPPTIKYVPMSNAEPLDLWAWSLVSAELKSCPGIAMLMPMHRLEKLQD